MEPQIMHYDGVRSQFDGRAGGSAVGTQGVFGGRGLPVSVSREKENGAGVRAAHFIPYRNGYHSNEERGMNHSTNVNYGSSQNNIVHGSGLAKQHKLMRDNSERDRYFESIGRIISDEAAANLKILFDEYSRSRGHKSAPLMGSSRKDEDFWLGCFEQLPREARDECILKGFGKNRYTEIKLREESRLDRLCGLTLSDDFPESGEIHKKIKEIFKKNLQLECAVCVLEEQHSDVEIIKKVLELVETRLKWSAQEMKEITDEIRRAIMMQLESARVEVQGASMCDDGLRRAFHEQQREKISEEFVKIQHQSPGILFYPQEDHVKKFVFLSNAESVLFAKLEGHRVQYHQFLRVYHGLYNQYNNEAGATADQWVGPTKPPGGCIDTPFALFKKVQDKGGYDKVCQEKEWASLFPVHGNAMKTFYEEHISQVENELAKEIMIELKPILAKMKAINDFEVENTSSSDTEFTLRPESGAVNQQQGNSATKKRRRQSSNGPSKYNGGTFTFWPSQELILKALKNVEETAGRGKFKYKNTFFPIFGLCFGSEDPKAQFKAVSVILPIPQFIKHFEKLKGRKPREEEIERFLETQKNGGIDKIATQEELAEYSQFTKVEEDLIDYSLKSKTFFVLNSQKN